MRTYLRVGKVIAEKHMRKDVIAEQLNVHPSLLSKMLTGERPWSYEQQIQIADILAVSTDDLFAHTWMEDGNIRIDYGAREKYDD